MAGWLSLSTTNKASKLCPIHVVELPEEMRVGQESELIEWVFPGIRHTGKVGGAVLCTRNNIVDSINTQVSDIFPGEEHVANSADALAMEDTAAIPVEYLQLPDAERHAFTRSSSRQGCL